MNPIPAAPAPADAPSRVGADLVNGRQPTRRRTVLGALAVLPAILAAACSGGSPQASPATATSGAGAENTKAPATSVPATSAPTRSAQPTSPPPVPTLSFISPLTGRMAEVPKIHRRIVGTKIDNAPLARPQFGLGQAEVVYEQLAEGGLTRFLAFFLEAEPDRVGPVRSARLTDIYLGQEWDFLLAYAGAGKTTSKLLAEALIPAFKAPELGDPLEGTPYWRDNTRPIPHNMFVHINQIRELAAKDPNIPKEVEIRPFPFAPAPTDSGPLRSIHMPYIPDAAVTWSYDPDNTIWKRTMAGAPHVDALDGQQIKAENIVIQYAEIFTAQNVEPDAAGNPVLDTVLRGTNKLRLFHSGRLYEGTWTKEHDRAKTQYKLDDGSPMPFRPGRVWFHIVPTDYQASWT